MITTRAPQNRHKTFIISTCDDRTIAGLSHKELTARGIEFVTGKASWEKLGRARMILGKAAGIARIYGDKKDGSPGTDHALLPSSA